MKRVRQTLGKESKGSMTAASAVTVMNDTASVEATTACDRPRRHAQLDVSASVNRDLTRPSSIGNSCRYLVTGSMQHNTFQSQSGEAAL